MSTITHNGFLAMMAKTIEDAICTSKSLFVDVYLDSMDCSLDVELAQLRELQQRIARNPKASHSDDVLRKYLFSWGEVDKFLSLIHI